jgi:hypothetical protein
VASLIGTALVAGAVGTTVLLGNDEPTPTTPSRPPAESRSGDDGSATSPKGAGSGEKAGTSSGSSGTSAGSAGTSSGSSSGPGGVEVSEMTGLTAAKGAAELGKAGVAPFGDVREALTWSDRNGRNLLVASRRTSSTTDANGTSLESATIRVVHVAHLESRPVVLRTMTDPGGPCELNFDNDVNGDYGVAGDLNRDGFAEVTVSWFSMCRGDPGEYGVKVAMLSNGDKYILRGIGWPGGKPDLPGDWADAKIQQTEPAAAAWPKGFHKATENVFFRLYH